ncbi:DNA polymerase [Rhizobium phage RL38J1]|uniref:DNA polymerase n=1 Tax=Rhizobium phage RL38J1 TaxID=2663232 RepID=A0A6B9J1I7_9CAUD|nr:DNA polymerase [Rhizobium phage RL38J1]QGZ14037.1 DNA polymerase [Rhizobium phage RL38J1]
MHINYFLVANGSSITPRITHAIFQPREEDAKEESVRVAKELSKAGYFNFHLYDKDDNIIESYRVETPEPVVTPRGYTNG